jgi:hypothetical protein
MGHRQSIASPRTSVALAGVLPAPVSVLITLLITVLVAVLITLLVAVAGPTGRARAATQTGFGPVPAGTPMAHPFAGDRTVGPLFPPGSAVHTCTASVVDSPSGDLLITATHCITGEARGYTFAPGYHDGVEPYGTWSVVGAYVDPQWTADRAPRLDVAFLRVAPRQMDGHAREIQSVTGGNRLGPAPSTRAMVTVPAYAVGHDDDPVTCTAPVYHRGVYPAFDCNPYVDGTSGAPWLLRTDHGWDVVGVIGGLHQGGCYPWTSYSAPFGPATTRTYDGAVNGAETSVLPPPESDGCTTGL